MIGREAELIKVKKMLLASFVSVKGGRDFYLVALLYLCL
jgi:hypothetical protein